ncbi:uncharacterized protein LOC120455710 [Drosophila santomea]|uniref:uncharacterized protein LOC120455710 n=1 Tax=Drosophila santomea TaxID=129105 RepID=UPI001952A108|nr:uncharacterized protein LOC120455710 [Drosophila santomea]
MFRRGLKALRVRPFAESISFLWRNVSGNSWKGARFVQRPGIAAKNELPSCPTLQRTPINNVVDQKAENPYSTFKIDHDRVQQMWQNSRIGAKEQNSLRGYQPANSDVNSESEEVISALDKVKRIEERRKIQKRMRSLLEEQQELDRRIQEEQDRAVTREVLVERDPARRHTPKEYTPVRNPENCKPNSWVSATVLAATGKMQHHRYMQTPPRISPIKVEAESQSPSKSPPDNPASNNTSGQPNQTKTTDMTHRAEWTKSVLELHKTRAEEMDRLRSLNGYSNQSACLKLSELSALRKIRYR